jgi:hypothetical protein
MDNTYGWVEVRVNGCWVSGWERMGVWTMDRRQDGQW